MLWLSTYGKTCQVSPGPFPRVGLGTRLPKPNLHLESLRMRLHTMWSHSQTQPLPWESGNEIHGLIFKPNIYLESLRLRHFILNSSPYLHNLLLLQRVTVIHMVLRVLSATIQLEYVFAGKGWRGKGATCASEIQPGSFRHVSCVMSVQGSGHGGSTSWKMMWRQQLPWSQCWTSQTL